jgi:hypothetical protein
LVAGTKLQRVTRNDSMSSVLAAPGQAAVSRNAPHLCRQSPLRVGFLLPLARSMATRASSSGPSAQQFGAQLCATA